MADLVNAQSRQQRAGGPASRNGSAQTSVPGQVVAFFKLIQDGFRWFDDNPDAVKRFGADVKHRGREVDAWRYLFDRVNGVTAISMQIGLVAEQRLGHPRRGELLSLLLGDAMTNPELLAELRELIGRSPASKIRRDQLVEGLDQFQAGRDHIAVPLLIHAIEGLFWAEAEQSGLIKRNESGKWETTSAAARPGRRVDGLESVLGLDELQLDDKFERFLRAVVYGGDGNPFRHGTADGGWQLRASFLVVALIGWLEIHRLISSHHAIHNAFVRAQARQRAERESPA